MEEGQQSPPLYETLEYNVTPKSHKRFLDDPNVSMEGLHLTPLSLKRLRSRDRHHPQSVWNPTELPTIERLEDAQESIRPGSPTFEELEDTQDGGPFDPRVSGPGSWFDAPIKLLLSSLEELAPRVGKSVRMKTKRKMWSTIKERFESHGYAFTISQIESKYRALERQFKKAMLHRSRSGRNRVTVPYEDELSRILKEKRGFVPEYQLSTEGHGETRQELLEIAGVGSLSSRVPADTPELITPTPVSARRRALDDQISSLNATCEELKTLIKNQIEAQNAYRARKKEREERKEERQERMLALFTEKNKLLEKIAERR